MQIGDPSHFLVTRGDYAEMHNVTFLHWTYDGWRYRGVVPDGSEHSSALATAVTANDQSLLAKIAKGLMDQGEPVRRYQVA